MKKIYRIFLLLLMSLTVIPLQAEEDFLDDIISWADSPENAQIIETEPITVATRSITREGILNLLEQLKIIPILQQDFFLRSNNIISRSLLDYPEFFPFRHDKDKNAVYVDLFYNQTSRCKFTKSSTNICTYLATTSPALRNAINTAIQTIRGIIPEAPAPDDILALLDLFSSFTVQERRLGLMLGGKWAYNRWHINVMSPLYYLERNHFVDPRVEEDVRELTEDLFGPSGQDPKAEKEFQDQHLISDKFGLGDTRVYADYPFIKNRFLNMRIGFLATIPTAFAFQKGLRGSNFHRVTSRPQLDLEAIFDALESPNPAQAQAIALPFFFAGLDNLSAMLLDSPLGNHGHLGLGVYLKNRTALTKYFPFDWARRLIWRSFMSFEYLLPGTELRSYVIPASMKDFTARNFSNTNTNQKEINDNFAFIEQQITNRLFPLALYTQVWPGFIFRSSSQLCYEGDDCGFTLGTDTYVRTKEKIRNIQRLPGKPELINITNSRAPFAYQSKLVGSVFFKVHQPDKLWTLSFIGDTTFMSKGLGQDFLLGFNVDVIF